MAEASNPQYNTTVAHEMDKQLEAEVRKQIEYYLSDANLKQDEFFYNTIKDSATKSIPVDALLNCNKIKKLNVSKEDILKAISNSEDVEINGDGNGIKRKNDRELPQFEPKVTKRVKTDRNSGAGAGAGGSAQKEESKGFDPKIYKITLSKADETVKWDKISGAIQNNFGIKVGYTRVNGTEGHIAVDGNALTEETKQKLGGGTATVNDVEIKVEECLGDDLKKFVSEHGRHLDMCLEKGGLKRKTKPGQKAQGRDTIDFVFNNQRYTSLSPLKQIFKSILAQTGDDEIIGASDQKYLEELLKYHEHGAEKGSDLKHFTVGTHPAYKQTRCFFVVKNDGTKVDFSTTKCFENIKNQFNVADDA